MALACLEGIYRYPFIDLKRRVFRKFGSFDIVKYGRILIGKIVCLKLVLSVFN